MDVIVNLHIAQFRHFLRILFIEFFGKIIFETSRSIGSVAASSEFINRVTGCRSLVTRIAFRVLFLGSDESKGLITRSPVWKRLSSSLVVFILSFSTKSRFYTGIESHALVKFLRQTLGAQLPGVLSDGYGNDVLVQHNIRGQHQIRGWFRHRRGLQQGSSLTLLAWRAGQSDSVARKTCAWVACYPCCWTSFQVPFGRDTLTACCVTGSLKIHEILTRSPAQNSKLSTAGQDSAM